MKKRLIIVDVSNFIFRAFFAIRSLNAPNGTPVNAVYGVLNMMLKLFSEYRPTHILFARDTAGGSFRNEIYSEYKANRTEPPDDLIPQFALIEQMIHLMKAPECSHNEFEADDVIGSACIQWKDYFDEILIASGDKDLMQFVDDKVKMLDTMKGKVYDAKEVFEKMGVRPDQIVDYLSIVGDSSDNIPGMKGIGAKGAAKLLEEYDTLDNCIANKDKLTGKKLITAFEEHLQDGLMSRELVKIKTDVDLRRTPEQVAFTFYPDDELVEFLKSLGFKTVIDKLLELRRNTDISNQSDEDSVFVDLGSESTKFQKNYIKVDSAEKWGQLKSAIASVGAISLFSHSSSLEHRERDFDACALSTDGEEIFLLYGDFYKSIQSEFLEATYLNDKIEIISDHIQFDHSILFQKGLTAKAQTFDISQVHYNVSSSGRHDLEWIARNYLDMDLPLKKDKKIGVLDLLEEEINDYLGLRALALFKVTKQLKEELSKLKLEKIYYEIDDKLFPVLAKMESEGISINKNFFKAFENELEVELKSLEEKVAAISETPGINLNSPKQVGELLFEKLGLPVIKRTKTGPSTDVEVLEELTARELSPIPELLLSYRELGKIQSTYVKALPELVNTHTGRVHTHFNQNVAQTGRLSSTNPNLQNIPIRSELGRKVRKGFIATPGKLLLSFDYSQVELRLLADFANDPTMILAFQENKDIHAQTASEVLGVDIKNVTSNQRSQAKAVNFGLMYGQSSFGLASALKISRAEARDYITAYFERFSQVKAYLDGLKERCETLGYAETYHGRKRLLPDIHSNNRNIKAQAERMAINSPIQGTAADIIKLAMIEIDRELTEKKLKSKMLLQVHDELIFEVEEEELKQMQELIPRCMENVVSLKVPLKVEMGLGVNWLDLK
jgi:DNA polymerase-1